MNEQKRRRAKSAQQDFRNTWHGTSNVAGAPEFGIQQTSEQTKEYAFRQKDIGIQLVRLKESVKRCSNHWDKKFSSAKKRRKEDRQQTTFVDRLNSLLSDFENFKKALPPEVLGLTRDGKQYQRDSKEASPSPPFPQRRDPQDDAGGFDQFRRDPIEVKPAPLHQEDTGRFKQPKRDPNEDILKQFQQRLDVLERKLEDTESRCRRAEDKARTLAAEKEDLMTRLSQVAGSKLRDNNPAITDLSDPNRPIKLVEKISELYDNEWTDGMEALEKSGMKESEALQVLLSVFTTSHEKCMEIARINIDNLQRQLLNPTNRQESYDDRMRDVPSHVLKQLKDARKVAAEYQVGIPAIIQEVDRVLAEEHGHRVVQSCRKYIDRCVEYSWYMRIQDPPLEIEYQYTIGGKFEHDKMRAYTMSGKYVEYVVWPAIYLHKGGAMLSKAVVQGQSEAVNARAINQGPSVISDEKSNRSTIEIMSTSNQNERKMYDRQSTFNTPVHYKSIKSQSDVDKLSKTVGPVSNFSNPQQFGGFPNDYNRPDSSRNDYSPYQQGRVKTPDQSSNPSPSHGGKSTPQSWSKHTQSSHSGYGTGAPSSVGQFDKRGKRNNKPQTTNQSLQKMWGTTQPTQNFDPSQQQFSNDQRRSGGQGNIFNQTAYIQQPRRTETPEKLTTYHDMGGRQTAL